MVGTPTIAISWWHHKNGCLFASSHGHLSIVPTLRSEIDQNPMSLRQRHWKQPGQLVTLGGWVSRGLILKGDLQLTELRKIVMAIISVYGAANSVPMTDLKFDKTTSLHLDLTRLGQSVGKCLGIITLA